MNNGAFGENFPYSNFHDLNMDWIIKIAKDFLDQYTHIQETIEEGLNDLQEKYDTLDALLQEWYDTHSEDIANQLADALSDLNSWYTEHQNYLDATLAQNIANFDSHADQKAAQTIASIPDDYTTLSNKVASISDYIGYIGNPISYNSYTGNYVCAGLFVETTHHELGTIQSNEYSMATGFIDVSDYEEISINNIYASGDRAIVSYKGTLEVNRLLYNGDETYFSFRPGEDDVYIRVTGNLVDDLQICGTKKPTQTTEFPQSTKQYIRQTNKGTVSVYEMPQGMTNIPINLYKEHGRFYTDFDIKNFKNTSTNVYYACMGGCGTKSGENLENAKDLAVLLLQQSLMVDNTTVYIADGVYRWGYINNNTFTKNINLIALHKGKVIIEEAGEALTYTHNGNNIYSANRTNVLKVFQIFDNHITELKHVTSVSELSERGTWHINNDNGYFQVHMIKNETPTFNNLFVILNYNRPLIEIKNTSQSTRIYLEGINFIGGQTGTIVDINDSTYYDSRLYLNECGLYGCTNGNGLTFEGTVCLSQNCIARYNNKDGFNYHKAYIRPMFVEVNNIGSDNGLDSDTVVNNGSTAHDGTVGVRLNGIYYNNKGANIADVHDDTTTININCIAYDSMAETEDKYNSDYCAQATGTTMYLYNCKAFGSYYSLYGTGNDVYSENGDYESRVTN